MMQAKNWAKPGLNAAEKDMIYTEFRKYMNACHTNNNTGASETKELVTTRISDIF